MCNAGSEDRPAGLDEQARGNKTCLQVQEGRNRVNGTQRPEVRGLSGSLTAFRSALLSAVQIGGFETCALGCPAYV